jgi:REP element-mobilizing transposase RayT
MLEGGFKIRDQSQLHFVTFTVTDWVDIFTRPVYKDIVIDALAYCQKNKGLILYGYVIMTNHVHLIIQRKEGGLSDLIRDIKRHIANTVYKQISLEKESRRDWLLKRFQLASYGISTNRDFKFWRAGNHPVEIISEHTFWNILNYIHLNPIKQGIVAKASHYLYSSASNYVNGAGKIEVEVLPMSASASKGLPSFIDLEVW